jgi:hypothetical protein
MAWIEHLAYFMISGSRVIIHMIVTVLIIVAAHASVPLLMGGSSSPQYIIPTYGQVPAIMNNDNGTTTTTASIDGIECLRAEQLAFHIHAKLNITMNNESYPIPAGIGINPNKCIYWLHTHDNSGIIHIESPIKRNFTLGQFLNIWNRFNSSDTVVQDIANNKINGTLTTYVNGTQMNNNFDYRNIELKDKELISIIISRQ